MLQMLLKRVIVLLPAVEVFVAQKAAYVIGVARLRVEKEAGSCKLNTSVQENKQETSPGYTRYSHQWEPAICEAMSGPWVLWIQRQLMASAWRWAAGPGKKRAGYRR